MSDIRPAFVFVHGAWHSAATWHRLIPLLEVRGYVARALDLPGGERMPKLRPANDRRPLDAAAFASEPSPNANLSQPDAVAETLLAIAGDQKVYPLGCVNLV